MRFVWFGLAFALLTFSASAQEKKNEAQQSSTSVLVNGQPVKGEVLEVDGKYFVAVEDLAQSLRGTIAYSDGQIALTLSQPPSTAAQSPVPEPSSMKAKPAIPQPPPAVAQQPTAQPSTVPVQMPQTGSVKGTLTYFFDFHVGNKPDTGSKVWLVKDHIELPADQAFVGSSTALGTSSSPEQYAAIKYSIADDKGNFELQDVPAGQYTLILQSAHTKGTLKEKRNLFGRGKSNLRDRDGRVESLNLQIKAGETANASKDFGPDVDR